MRTLREWFLRLLGSLRPWRRAGEREAELQAHYELAVDEERRRGLTPEAAARAARLRVGGLSQALDAVHDQRGLPGIDSLFADLRCGWRQILRSRTANAAAILSLGLAIGATMAAFRLVDAVLLRPLPVVEPARLFMAVLGDDTQSRDDLDYPEFRDYSAACRDVADGLLLGMTGRTVVLFEGASQSERVYRQYVSGNAFPIFGLVPATGRLLSDADDEAPGAHAVAVLSYDFWTRRFGNDPNIVGRTFRDGSNVYQIVGVAPRGFTGTEPGRLVDVFAPSTMNVQALDSPGWGWFRMWVRPKNGVTPEQVRAAMQARLTARNAERAKTMPADTSPSTLAALQAERMNLVPAGSGTSGLQRTFRTPLIVLAALVALVLLIACGNVANILATRAVARNREMALRVSIGAGRGRLVQMLLVESFIFAVLSSAVGLVFAQWSAPFVVSLLAVPEDPVGLVLGLDARAGAFCIVVTFLVTGVLGLAPALRASAIRPVLALKNGGEAVAHRRLTQSLVTLQMAFSVFVLFVAVLFGTTFTRLLSRPTGYSDANVVLLDTETRGSAGSAADWSAVLNTLRATHGVASAAAAGWVPLSDSRWRGSVKATAAGEPVETHFLQVSPGYFGTLHIGLIAGREFEDGDVPPPGQGNGRRGSFVVNEAFAKAMFGGGNPVGKEVIFRLDSGVDATVSIVGLVRDTVYYRLRDRMPPIAYMPIATRDEATILVLGATDARALAPLLQQRVADANANFRVKQAMLQRALVTRQVIRERLLATLSTFFGIVGLLVAVVGLYGVLSAAVQQRQREIGIRLALGAGVGHVVRRLTLVMIALVGIGAAIGLAGGVVFGRLIRSLLFGVASTDVVALAMPIALLSAAALVAALPPALRAARLDPVRVLRCE